MIYICINDNFSKEDLINNNKIAPQVILSSVISSTHAFDIFQGKLHESGDLHRKIRFYQFKSFDETIRATYNDVSDMYLKYGGFCFLNNDIKERFDVVKHNLDFIASHEYKVDIWKNDLLLQKAPNSNTFDKFILKRILETKETGLIYYRPKKFTINGHKEAVKELQNATNEEIKQCPLLRKVF